MSPPDVKGRADEGVRAGRQTADGTPFLKIEFVRNFAKHVYIS